MFNRDREKVAAASSPAARQPPELPVAPMRQGSAARGAEPGQDAAAPESRPTRWLFADAPLRTVTVDGAAIRYRLWENAPADAPTLLFLHGFRAHSRWWDHIVPFFWDRYRVAAMDFSGLGDSHWRETYTMRTFAREVLAVIADAGLAPVTVVAHSFGGSPAAFASTLQPDAIAHAIIVDSRMILRGVPEPEQSELQAFAPGKRVYPDLEEVRRRYRLLPVTGTVDPELMDHIALASARPVEGGWAWKFDGKFDSQLSGDPDRLVPPDVSIPMDYIYGDRSAVITPSLAERIVSLLPGCAAPIAVPHSDHHVLLEQPVALVSVLRALLARGPARRGEEARTS